MPSSESLRRVDRYWSDQLAISSEALHSQGVLVVPHAAAPASFCLVFKHHACTCVRLPQPYSHRLAPLIRQQDGERLLRADWWRHCFGDVLIDAIGPAYLGYADAGTLQPVTHYPTRLLTPADAAALAAFAAVVGSTAWEHSGLGEEPQPIAGCWEAETLVAAAGYRVWGSTLAHIGVATHPGFRGRGYGTTVVSAIGQYALGQGYVPQYRTLLANTPSIAIAGTLGFQPYATTLYLSFHAARDP